MLENSPTCKVCDKRQMGDLGCCPAKLRDILNIYKYKKEEIPEKEQQRRNTMKKKYNEEEIPGKEQQRRGSRAGGILSLFQS